mgnify:CR=1 FL=1
MRLLITFLLVTSSATVFALDPYLTRSSGNMCYYDDGSVINNGGRICPRRLSSNNGTSGITVPNLGPSQESIDWRLLYGQGRAQGLNTSINNLLQLALQKRRQAEAAKLANQKLALQKRRQAETAKLANQSRTNRTISPTTPQKSPEGKRCFTKLANGGSTTSWVDGDTECPIIKLSYSTKFQGQEGKRCFTKLANGGLTTSWVDGDTECPKHER